jgi:hypothetical protein
MPLDQQDEQVEIAGDERYLAPFAQEEPAPGREREITEAVSNHDGWLRPRAIVSDHIGRCRLPLPQPRRRTPTVARLPGTFPLLIGAAYSLRPVRYSFNTTPAKKAPSEPR